MKTSFYKIARQDKKLIDRLTEENIFKIFPAGNIAQNISVPYISYSLISGITYNTLSNRSKADNVTLQVDIYAKDYNEAYDIFEEIRYAVELEYELSSMNIVERDSETQNYRISFDVDYISLR